MDVDIEQIRANAPDWSTHYIDDVDGSIYIFYDAPAWLFWNGEFWIRRYPDEYEQSFFKPL